ncbi:MAG: hypothetical protein H6Q70_1472 [Firmicutes bacterium]|nr:hypothetical protein [Bacillota bacterium]
MLVNNGMKKFRGVVHQTVNGRNSSVTQTGISQDIKASKAAIFQRSTLADYDGKKLSTAQEGMMKLQEQISSIKGNDDIDQKTKDDLVKTLTAQLEDLQKQLNDPQQTEANNGEKDKKENSISQQPSSNGTSSDDGMYDLIGMSARLDQAKTMGSLSNEASSRAKLEKEQLEHDMNNPREALQLKDKNIIAKREESISNLENTTERLQDVSVSLNTTEHNNVSEKTQEDTDKTSNQPEAHGTLDASKKDQEESDKVEKKSNVVQSIDE